METGSITNPKYLTASEEQMEVACQGMVCSGAALSVWYHHPDETGRAVWEPGT